MTEQFPGFYQALRQSQFTKILLIALLILFLEIPIVNIEGVIQERQASRHQATQDISGKWGAPQHFTGPLLILPYVTESRITTGGTLQTRQQQHQAVFLPQSLHINASLSGDTRYRGIYQVPVYQSQLQLTGQFEQPQFSKLAVKATEILWHQARLVILIADPHAIKSSGELVWAQQTFSFEPSAFADPSLPYQGIHVPLELKPDGDNYRFNIDLAVNGSESISFSPAAKDSQITLSGDTSQPSFQGHWLPDQRNINEQGFTASWQIPALGRNIASQWPTLNRDSLSSLVTTHIGARFLPTLDTYRLSARSVKYSSLFLVLTFAVIWVFEILRQQPVHLIQYLLIGSSMCLFYLLLLALSEHLGFLLAYMLASTLVVMTITGYCLATLRSSRHAGVVAVILTLLYLYLYVLLQQQDLALISGSLGLFALLTLVMYLTRHIDWYSVGQSPLERQGEQQVP